MIIVDDDEEKSSMPSLPPGICYTKHSIFENVLILFVCTCTNSSHDLLFFWVCRENANVKIKSGRWNLSFCYIAHIFEGRYLMRIIFINQHKSIERYIAYQLGDLSLYPIIPSLFFWETFCVVLLWYTTKYKAGS